jgi:spoIIIJ-associated protein
MPQRRTFVSDLREQAGDHDAATVETAPVPIETAAEHAAPTDGDDSTPAAEDSAGGQSTRVRVSSRREAPADDQEGSDSTPGDQASAQPEDGGDPESALETEAEIAADYLEELLDIADLDGDIDTYIEGHRAHVSIVSESEVLVGAHGEVLDALQELTRLAVMTETGDRSRLMLDVAGFRDRRRKELMSLAAAAVEESKSSNAPVALAAMNPFERKIVHDAVAAAGLTSESEGDEPKRHVVVHPTK